MRTMQQKRGFLRLRFFVGVIGAAVVVAMGVLMFTDVPAQQKPIEKELDAKAFLAQKPQ